MALNEKQAKAYLILGGGAIAILIICVIIVKSYGGFSKAIGNVTDFLGLSESEEAKARREAVKEATDISSTTGSPWSPQFYKDAPAGAKLITVAAAKEISGQIWDSVSIWQIPAAKPAEALGALKRLSAKSQVSFLAEQFNKQYNKDLYSWITLQFSTMGGKPTEGLTQIINYVKNLPNY